ncbi:MAG: ParB/RepB/Spo0J family partition protein [Planctomycetota bacterium]|nr:ParB/RepB/Spo0J family partition protein [Planctomycetota bacterium]
MIRKSKFRTSFLNEIEKTVKARGGKAEQDIEALNAPIDKVYPDPEQPRGTPDPESDDMVSLRRSIQSFGILEPLLVIRDSKGLYRLIAGHRRLLAAQSEGRSHVPVRVLRMKEDIGQVRLIQLTENLQRKDLSPIEVGLCLVTVANLGKLKQVELAKKLGLSQPMIAYYLSMKKICKKAVKEIEKRSEDFTFKFLIKLARLKSEKEQLQALEDYRQSLGEGTKVQTLPQGANEDDQDMAVPTRQRHKGRAYRWRPRLRFQCRDYDFDVTRASRPEQKSIKVEVPMAMDEKEILEAFKSVYRKMTGLDWSQIDADETAEEVVDEGKTS